MTDTSPYTAPDMPPTPTRWRILPASLLMIFGAMQALMPPLLILIYVAGLSREPFRASSPTAYVCGLLLMACAGVVGFFAGRFWWQRRWKAAIIGTVLWYGLGAVGGSLAWPQMNG